MEIEEIIESPEIFFEKQDVQELELENWDKEDLIRLVEALNDEMVLVAGVWL